MTRLDLAAAIRFGLSRRAAREAVRSGRVDVDGQTRDEPGAEIADSADLSFHPSRPARRRVRARLSVLAEGPDFVVVDKPAGLLTVPTAEHETDTLLARTLEYLHLRFRRRPFAGVVHRLDRDTSGAVVFARNRTALRYFQELFRSHRAEREYLALVEGRLADAGRFDADLVRDAGVGRRGVARRGAAGKRAVTRFEVEERFPGATFVRVRLETGRTHQIRIHFSAAGHPVVGDRVYGTREAATIVPAPRQMLHARLLGFPDPATGERVRAESPLPADFAQVLSELRKKASRATNNKKAPRRPGR